MNESASPWNDWLDSAECRATLKAAAQFIFRQAARLSLPADLLPCTDPWSLPVDQREDCFQMLAAELWIFLRSQTGAQLEKLACAAQLYSQGRSPMLKLAQHFLRSLQDQARTLGRDPTRALYRRLRQVLQETPDVVHYLAGPNGVYFSLKPDAPVLTDLEALRADRYESWGAPLNEVNRSNLTQRKSLLRLAASFYQQAVRRTGGDYYLPLRELLSYIRCHYAELSGVAFESLEEGHEEQAAGAGGAAAGDSQRAGVLAIVDDKLPELAEQIVAAWSPKQRQAFALIQGEELGLEAAAARLGYSSAAGVRYVYQHALTTLRDFCLLWPGLAPPALDERLFERLILTVIGICRRLDGDAAGEAR